MGQTAALRAMDARIMSRLRNGTGLADGALYTPSQGGQAIPCSVYVDRGVTLVGAQGQVINVAALITAFASEIGLAPKRGARFVIEGETFTVDSLNERSDESRHICVVKPGV